MSALDDIIARDMGQQAPSAGQRAPSVGQPQQLSLDSIIARDSGAANVKPYAYSEAPLTPEEQAKYASAPRIETAGTSANPAQMAANAGLQSPAQYDPTEGMAGRHETILGSMKQAM